MTKRIYGHTKSGRPVDDDVIEALADEAEAGYGVDQIVSHRGKRGRPRLGAAQAEGVAVAEVIREALRHHLEAS